MRFLVYKYTTVTGIGRDPIDQGWGRPSCQAFLTAGRDLYET